MISYLSWTLRFVNKKFFLTAISIKTLSAGVFSSIDTVAVIASLHSVLEIILESKSKVCFAFPLHAFSSGSELVVRSCSFGIFA